MKFRWGRMLAATLALPAAALLLTQSERITEINAASGSTRTRITVAWVWKGAWKESPTWIAERAKLLGVPIENQWQNLGTVRHFGVSISRGCSRAPASYDLKSMPEDAVPEEKRDAFVRQFAAANEKEREEILRQLF